VAVQTKGLAVGKYVPQFRKPLEWFNVMGLKFTAAPSTAATCPVVSLKNSLSPFPVFGASVFVSVTLEVGTGLDAAVGDKLRWQNTLARGVVADARAELGGKFLTF
jgi:hypothetical protein